MKVPQYLHRPLQVLWWESDEFAIIVLFLILALFFGNIFFIPMVLVPYIYGKLKKMYPRGFLKHIFCLAGFKKMSNYPDFFIRDFAE